MWYLTQQVICKWVLKLYVSKKKKKSEGQMQMSRFWFFRHDALRTVSNTAWANMRRTSPTVRSVVVEDICLTSSHLEWLSITTENWWGPFWQRSMWMRWKGRVAHFQGIKGALGGELLTFWQTVHNFTSFSISSSIFGHQTHVRAMAFIAQLLGCSQCNSFNILSLNTWGIITLEPHKTRLCSQESSWLLMW